MCVCVFFLFIQRESIAAPLLRWRCCLFELVSDFTLLQQLPRRLQNLITRDVASFSVAAASLDWKMKADLRF